MTISEELVDAYHATSYSVRFADKIIHFRVEQVAPEIDQMLKHLGQQEWVFMTACNPHSELLSIEENDRRLQLFQELLVMNGVNFFRGEGVSDAGDWPEEAGLFIPGLSRQKGVAYGRVFGQHAIISGHYGASPEYVYC